MIQISGVVKRFPTVTALDGVSLFIEKGEFFGLLGPNGAGKSTLMNLLIGYLDPDEGELTIEGERITRDNLQVRRRIGLVPQSLALYDDISALENMQIFGSFYGIESRTLTERIKERLEAVQLYERRKDKVKTFSGGMKRRLNLVASLLHDPPLLLCDEPTVGVDPQSRNAIFDYLAMLNGQGITIVYTTHYMEEVERLCSRIAIIDAGKVIAAGTLDDLMATLEYDESISIVKNRITSEKVDALRSLGAVVVNHDRIELRPEKGASLSSVFARLEQHGITPKMVELPKPTLETLFLHMTGRRLRD